MQRIGLIPSDDETSSTSSAVGARFGCYTLKSFHVPQGTQ